MWRLNRVAVVLTWASVAFADQARDNAWRQDLSTLASQLPRLRLNFSSSVSPAVFSAAVAQLDSSIPTLSDAEIVTGMAQIVALLNDPHTSMNLPQTVFPMRRIPLRLQWFRDGLFVTAAPDAFARAVGARVAGIGSMSTDDAYRTVAAAISHQNDEWLRYLTPSYLINADVLAALKVIPDPAIAHLEFQDLGGAQFAFDIPTSLAPAVSVIAPDASTGFTPLYRRNASQFYWYTYLENSRILYFKYNSCQNIPGLPFTQFAPQVLGALDANPVKSFIVDLRGNTGGDSSVIDPLLTGIGQRANRFRTGLALDVFVDEGTISSGLLNAESLQGFGYATLFGAPTGGTPNHYGNIGSFTLPNSRLQINYSTRFFSSSVRTDALLPDVPVALASSDYFARFDPVLASLNVSVPVTRPPSGIAVVNAATLRAGDPVSPGSLATVFGDFSQLPAADAKGVPWPKSLSGVAVLVNGVAAPLLAVRPTQINFQIPGTTPLGFPEIRITRDGADVATDAFAVTAASPGMFVVSATDISRPGAILNQDSALNSATAVARRGDIVQIYATGQGPSDPPAEDGSPGGSDPPSISRLSPRVIFGIEPAEVLYSGLSPELPGVWQINARVPNQPSVSGQVPVYVVQGSALSNAVTVWVEK